MLYSNIVEAIPHALIVIGILLIAVGISSAGILLVKMITGNFEFRNKDLPYHQRPYYSGRKRPPNFKIRIRRITRLLDTYELKTSYAAAIKVGVFGCWIDVGTGDDLGVIEEFANDLHRRAFDANTNWRKPELISMVDTAYSPNYSKQTSPTDMTDI